MNRHARRAQEKAPLSNVDLIRMRDLCRQQRDFVSLALIPFDEPAPPSYVKMDSKVEGFLREALYWFGVAASAADRALTLSGEPRRAAVNMLDQAFVSACNFRDRATRLTFQLDQLVGGVAGHA